MRIVVLLIHLPAILWKCLVSTSRLVFSQKLIPVDSERHVLVKTEKNETTLVNELALRLLSNLNEW